MSFESEYLSYDLLQLNLRNNRLNIQICCEDSMVKGGFSLTYYIGIAQLVLFFNRYNVFPIEYICGPFRLLHTCDLLVSLNRSLLYIVVLQFESLRLRFCFPTISDLSVISRCFWSLTIDYSPALYGRGRYILMQLWYCPLMYIVEQRLVPVGIVSMSGGTFSLFSQ